MKSRTKYFLVAVFTMLLLVVGQTAGPLATTASAGNVIEVQSFGSSYGEWSARWWQWLLSIPAAVNPNFDTTGDNAGIGQFDDVWFLAGAFGGTFERKVTVPAGKPLFFPIINTIALKPFGFETLLNLRKLASDDINSVISTSLEATIDGKAVQNLQNFRVRSPAFTVIAPAQGVLPPGQLSVPGNTDPLVSDGYWLLLSPLSAGSHTIHFHAEKSNGFMLDVTYHLTVGP